MNLKQIIIYLSCMVPLALSAQHMVLAPKQAGKPYIFNMGTPLNPEGHSLLCSSQSLLLDGKPIVPVMGELHFSRVDSADWHNELLKMKAGGVSIVSTYLFWIHHEEQQGRYRFDGNRNLRAFLQECENVHMPVVLRVGPFAHGEVRNGGLPDWLLETGCKVRSTDSVYLHYVDQWFGQIARQTGGMLWKDGGPVVGVQIENECRGPWKYMMALKQLLLQHGFDVPLYTRTGWPAMSGKTEFGQILPLYGDYADGFWDRSLKDMPGSYREAFTFKPSRLSGVIATEQLPATNPSAQPTDMGYPYFTCELGGGMMTGYTRRVRILPGDALALAICKVGAGSNLPGYYMYHGGTNPDGVLHPLNETQQCLFTNYNELPQKTYDFQAPLNEMGQANEWYYSLRQLHRFLADFGGSLAGMQAQFPDSTGRPGNLRWTVRSNAEGSGFVFVNNYERLKAMPAIPHVRFSLTTPQGKRVNFPSINVPSGASFVLPFNLKFGGKVLTCATAQPLCILNGKEPTLVLAAIKGIKPVLKWQGGKPRKARVRIISADDALHALKLTLPGRDSLLIAPGMYYQHNNMLYHEQWDSCGNVSCTYQGGNTSARLITMGARGVAGQPADSCFFHAPEWSLTLPANAGADSYLCINYQGDVARVYADGKLIEDNFWNGNAMWVPVKHLLGKKVTLSILPLYSSYPLYLQAGQRKALSDAGGKLLSVDKVTLWQKSINAEKL